MTTMMVNWWPLGEHLMTTWWPFDDYLVTSWWPPGGHLVTTWWPTMVTYYIFTLAMMMVLNLTWRSLPVSDGIIEADHQHLLLLDYPCDHSQLMGRHCDLMRIWWSLGGLVTLRLWRCLIWPEGNPIFIKKYMVFWAKHLQMGPTKIFGGLWSCHIV